MTVARGWQIGAADRDGRPAATDVMHVRDEDVMAFIDGKQIAAAREGYLDAAELDPLGPAGSPPVRPDVLMGWRRSRSWAALALESRSS